MIEIQPMRAKHHWPSTNESGEDWCGPDVGAEERYNGLMTMSVTNITLAPARDISISVMSSLSSNMRISSI